MIMQILPGANVTKVENIFNEVSNSKLWQEFTFNESNYNIILI